MSIKLMTEVWDKTHFKGTELLVLLCLADHANDDGFCWPSYKRLALRARCTRRTAMRCLESLIAEGWVAKSGRKPIGNGGYVNIYRVGKRGDILSPSGRFEAVQRGDKKDEGGDIFIWDGVTPVSPKPSLEPSEEAVSEDELRTSATPLNEIPPIEEAEEFVALECGVTFTHSRMCAEAWLKSMEGKTVTNWEACLSGFADKFDADHRR